MTIDERLARPDVWVDGDGFTFEMPYHAFVDSGDGPRPTDLGGILPGVSGEAVASALGHYCARCENGEGHPAHGPVPDDAEISDEAWEPLWDAEWRIATLLAELERAEARIRAVETVANSFERLTWGPYSNPAIAIRSALAGEPSAPPVAQEET